MNKNAMFVDHWEEFNQKRVEFRKMMEDIIEKAYLKGGGDCNDDGETETVRHFAREYAEEKIKDLF